MEDELAERWRRGDGGAHDALVDRLTGLLLRFFANKAGEARVRLVDETIARVGTIAEPPSPIRVHALRTAVEVLSEFRAQEPTVTYDGGVLAVLAGAEPSAPYREWRRAIEALRRLPLEHQIALELYYWEGLGYDELAQVLDLHEYTLRSRLKLGRERLQRLLQERPQAD
jgi:RNA polymerase sigma-70 factor (ECF subfamily)